MPFSLVATASNQTWLEPIEVRLQQAVAEAFQRLGPNRDRIENFLHGAPLGHPLHVMLTDIPIGAWTTALVFDRLATLSRRDDWARAARGAIAVGLVGALGAAAAGLTDWHKLEPPARRVGLVHGLLNLVGVAAFTASFVRRRRPGAGRLLAAGGYALVIVSARLGGHLVYRAGVGVQPAGQARPTPVQRAA